MTWVKLDDKRALNLKLRRAGFAARGLDEAAICQAASDQSDGYLSTQTVEMLATAHGEKRWRPLVEILCQVGRWEPASGREGWLIHDYLEFNPTRQELEQLRAERAVAGRKGGKAKANAKQVATDLPEQTISNGSSKRVSKTLAVPSRPVLLNPVVELDPVAEHPEKSDRISQESTTDSPPPPAAIPLIDRWLGIVEHGNRPFQRADATRTITHLLDHLDPSVIDETIGRCALETEQGNPPGRAKYLLIACRRWAGQNGITIPDPPSPLDVTRARGPIDEVATAAGRVDG